MRLQWDTPDRGPVTGYQVLRRQPSLHAVGVFEPIVEDTGSTSTSYVDTEVNARTQYVYRVAAVNADHYGTMDYSDVALRGDNQIKLDDRAALWAIYGTHTRNHGW